MKKRLMVVFLAFIIVFTGISGTSVTASVTDDIEITGRVNETSISENVQFTLYLTFEFGDEIKDVKYEIDLNADSSFVVTGGASKVDKVGSDQDDIYAVNLRYKGGSNLLPIKISYKKGNEPKNNEIYNLEITQIDEDRDSSPSNSNNAPKLIIESTSIPAAAAGENMQIPLTVTNDSRYTAKNISLKLTPENGADSPFEMESLSLVQSISSLSSKKSEGMVFKLKVKPYAEAGTYKMSADFKFYNTKNDYFTSSETIYVKVTNNKNEPMLLIEDIKYSANPVNAGARMQVGFNLSNLGDLEAKGVKISIEGLEKDKFTLSSGVDSFYFDTIKGNEKKNLVLSLLADDSMESGNYSLGVKMEYTDQRNKVHSNSTSFFINVQGASKSSNIALENITVMPQQVKANENFLLSFDVNNQGKSNAKNVKLTVKGDEGIISKSPDVRIIEGLAAGEHKKLEYMLYANSEAKTQNYNIMITLEYEEAEKPDTKHTVTQYAGVFVNGGNSKITPKIIISNYNFEPKVVRAGEEFHLDLVFMNTSLNKEVKNVKIYLTGIDSDKEGNIVFTPVGSSNTFFVDAIKPKGTASRGITMYTIPDAQPKYYNITANIEYQDEDGTEYKAEELIGIPVIQQSKLDASEISIMPEAYIGQPFPVSLQYYNKGKTKLSNLMIKVEGDFQIENGEAFIGNFESGSSDYFEAMVTPMKPGQAAGKVVFSFEDPSGDEFTYEREFTVNAMEMPPMEMPGEMPQPPESIKDKIMNNTIKNKYFWIGIVVVAAGIFTSRKLIRKKRRKDIELDE